MNGSFLKRIEINPLTFFKCLSLVLRCCWVGLFLFCCFLFGLTPVLSFAFSSSTAAAAVSLSHPPPPQLLVHCCAWFSLLCCCCCCCCCCCLSLFLSLPPLLFHHQRFLVHCCACFSLFYYCCCLSLYLSSPPPPPPRLRVYCGTHFSLSLCLSVHGLLLSSRPSTNQPITSYTR